MISKLLSLLTTVLLLFSTACASVYVNEPAPEHWQPEQMLRMVVLDTDRSDAMLLTCGGEAMLVDGGLRAYEELLRQTLLDCGVTHLKYLFSTHSDNDHIEGLECVMRDRRFTADVFMSPHEEGYEDPYGCHNNAMVVMRSRQVPYHQVQDGERLTLGGAELTVLRNEMPWGRNARSAVLMVRFGDASMLLTGDIDIATMMHFEEKYGAEALRADVLKAPHHGMAFIPETFFDMVNPEAVFVNQEKRFAYGFVGRMKQDYPEIPVLYSGDGTLLFETDGIDWYVRRLKTPE